jgi:hypothetical protein
MESQGSATTRRTEYITCMLPWAHGHQRKAIGDFVTAIIDQQTGCQAQLARSLGNQEAAPKRWSRLLHKERLEPRSLADAVLLQALGQRPTHGPVRLAIDWTIAGHQHVLVVSLVLGRRAVPIYWRAYDAAVRKGRMQRDALAVIRRAGTRVIRKVGRRRVRVVADRGCAEVPLFALLSELGVAFVMRGTSFDWVDDHDLGPLCLGLGNERPMVQVGAERITRPENEGFCILQAFRGSPWRWAKSHAVRGAGAGVTEGALTDGGPELVAERIANIQAMQDTLGPQVAIGENCRRPVGVDHRPPSRLERVQGLLPGKTRKVPAAFRARPFQRVEDALGAVDPVRIVVDLDTDVSTLFRTQTLVDFSDLLIGQRGKVAMRRMAALAVREHFKICKRLLSELARAFYSPPERSMQSLRCGRNSRPPGRGARPTFWGAGAWPPPPTTGARRAGRAGTVRRQDTVAPAYLALPLAARQWRRGHPTRFLDFFQKFFTTSSGPCPGHAAMLHVTL